MNVLQMQIIFHDILENTSALFATTSERPTSTVVTVYLNEAQNRFFNERYLAGDVIQNITIAKSLKTELKNMLSSKTITLGKVATYPNAFSMIEGNGDETTWDEFEYYVEGNVKVKRESILTCTADYVELLPISAINLNKYITNFTNVPILPQPVIIVDNGLSASPGMIITDQYTTLLLANGDEPNFGEGEPAPAEDTYPVANIVVLERPTTLKLSSSDVIFQTCDIDKRFHEQIVRLAVEMFLGDKGKFARPQQQTKE